MEWWVEWLVFIGICTVTSWMFRIIDWIDGVKK